MIIQGLYTISSFSSVRNSVDGGPVGTRRPVLLSGKALFPRAFVSPNYYSHPRINGNKLYGVVPGYLQQILLTDRLSM